MIYFILGFLFGVLSTILQVILENRYRYSPVKRIEQVVPRAVQGEVVRPKTDLEELLTSEEDVFLG